ncbi:uncharacterized protein LOC121429934 [Lytechinus variegatus]|uniref:uncharacterized protein LOC121429934 n=1 Tax=Lytechinus variegatus TaxID=7654 RepID=UPI001BB10628|nr:uncharacterized protein LOC121429934 [Lytechinus variegatus]
MEPSAVANFVEIKIKESQTGLLNELDKLISSKLGSFQQKINENQRDLSDIQIAKIEEVSKDEFKFRRRGNEEQYKLNSKVLSKIKQADVLLSEEHDGAKGEARSKLSEGMELIEYRQKIIKLADSSEGGWTTVDEYVRNDLADDSDDEKRIMRAEARAQRKKKAGKLLQKKRVSRFSPYRPYFGANQQNSTSSGSAFVVNASPFSAKKPGACFSCGKPGHWRAECKEAGSSYASPVSSQYNKLSDNSHLCNQTNREESIHGCDNTENDGCKISSPVGSLKKGRDYWKEIGANSEILSILDKGYVLPFMTLPDDADIRNNRSAIENSSFVEEEIGKLIKKGCVSELKKKPKVVNPLTVSNNKAKLRMVLDCRHVNPHLFKQKFKYEDAKAVCDVFEKGDFVFTYDLKSAYHHIEIHDDHKEYLGFAWNFNGIRRYFVFNVLPFGLSTAGYVFSKIMRPVVSHWRNQGHKAIMFLDDGIAGLDSLEGAKSFSVNVQLDLRKLGFLLANEKCDWEPKSRAKWLGLDWDFIVFRSA